MKKCQTCIWGDKRSGTKVFCPFFRCVKPENVDDTKEKKHDTPVDGTIKDEGG